MFVNVAVADLCHLGRSTIPVGFDKRPLFPWGVYQQRLPTAEEISDWSMRSPPAWAMVTGGVSGIITLDFDGPAGVETMKGLRIEAHRISGSGGFHADFVHPGWLVKTLNCKSARELGERYPGMDIRADGGYIIAVGRNQNGEYRWLRDPGTPHPLDILPVELREFLGLEHAPEDPGDLLTAGDTEPAEVASTRPSRSSMTQPVAPLIGAPGHPPPLPAVQAHVLLRRAFQEVNAGIGRNDAGFRLCIQLRDNRFTRDEAAALAATYVAGVPSVNTKGQPEPYTTLEFMASLRSAYSEKPRDPWGVDRQLETDTWSGHVDSKSKKPEAAGVGVEADARAADTEPAASAESTTSAPMPTQPAVPAESGAPAVNVPDTKNDGELLSMTAGAANAALGDTQETEKRVVRLRPEVPEGEKQKARVSLKQALHLDVVRIVMHGEPDGFHVLHLLDERRVDLGRTMNFASERAVRIAVMGTLGSQLPPIKKGAWRKVLDDMLKLVEVEAGFTSEEMVTEWVELFLRAAIQVPSLKEATSQVARAFDAFNGKLQFQNRDGLYETGPGGVVVLKLRPLYQHVTSLLSAKLSQPDLAVLLARVGFRKCSTFNGPMWMGERLRLQRVWVAHAANFHIKDTIQYESDGPRYAPEPRRPDPGPRVQ